MKLLLPIILFPFLLHAQSNKTSILGSWVKIGAEMKDGSRIIERNGNMNGFTSGFLQYTFLNDGLVNINTNGLRSQGEFNYVCKGKSLILANLDYDIVKLTIDSLTLEQTNPDLKDNKLKRIFFIRRESYHNHEKPEFNIELKDSVYKLSDFCFPHDYHDGLLKFSNQLKNYSTRGSLKLSFIVKNNGLIFNLKAIQNKNVPPNIERALLDSFKNSNSYWLPAIVNNKHVNVSVEILVKFFSDTLQNGMKMRGNNILTPFQLKESAYKALSLDLAGKSDEAYIQGLDFAKKHQYDKAIEKLTTCLEIDEINLDAYYLRAAMNFEKGNKEAACHDWQKLTQFGQVLASKYAAKYCK